MIGLFDSGIGGLSVLRALEALYPEGSFLYYADTANFPYGEKSPIELERHCSRACGLLLSKGARQIVVACHTASAYCLPALQARFPVPIIGMVEPTVIALSNLPPLDKIALMGTKATIDSQVYQRAIGRDIVTVPCPELARKIETHAPDTQELIRRYLTPLTNNGINTLVLGCTHYGHIQQAIEEELDPNTTVLNPAVYVAKLLSPPEPTSQPTHSLYTSGDNTTVKEFLKLHPLSASLNLIIL